MESDGLSIRKAAWNKEISLILICLLDICHEFHYTNRRSVLYNNSIKVGRRIAEKGENHVSTSANASFQVIMDATEALIQEKGCRQTTLQDIITRTGLSKGAIYHYVTGKDELCGLLLKSRVMQINARFTEVVNSPQSSGLANPLELIAEGMLRSTSHSNVTNQIFIYLLSQMDNEKVAKIIQEVFAFTLQTCIHWIEMGKAHGVIPQQLDEEKVAERLVTFLYGMRVQNTITQNMARMTVEELVAFMTRSLS
jgi:AcrR family transcriptional regulator